MNKRHAFLLDQNVRSNLDVWPVETRSILVYIVLQNNIGTPKNSNNFWFLFKLLNIETSFLHCSRCSIALFQLLLQQEEYNWCQKLRNGTLFATIVLFYRTKTYFEILFIPIIFSLTIDSLTTCFTVKLGVQRITKLHWQ